MVISAQTLTPENAFEAARPHLLQRRADGSARRAAAQALAHLAAREGLDSALDKIEALPAEGGLLAGLGRALIERGAFELAARTLALALEAEPDHYGALLGTSALLNRAGRPEAARRAMIAAARACPIETPARVHPDRPNAIRFRGLDNARYVASHSPSRRAYKMLFKGGHFSIRDLLDKERLNLYVANIQGDSLDQSCVLPPLHLAITTIGCADLGRDALQAADRFMRRHPDLPVINAPDRVLETTRDRNYDRLGGIKGLRFPMTKRIVIDAKPRRLARSLEEMGFTYPLILRRAGTQTGKSVALIASRDEARTAFKAARPGEEYYVIAYLDCRDARGRHRKIRAFFIDGVFYPVACLGSDEWQIHSGDRYRIMSETADLQTEEQAYLADPEAFLGETAFTALHAVRDAVGLDFFGIDFAVDADGRAVIFEVNPAMRHNFNHAGNFPYTRPYLERVSRAFDRMAAERSALGAARWTPVAPLAGM